MTQKLFNSPGLQAILLPYDVCIRCIKKVDEGMSVAHTEDVLRCSRYGTAPATGATGGAVPRPSKGGR